MWNSTIANLTLMALGSSAPEILLAVIETISGLGDCPGELGASTIVGSAAFNLLIISAVSIYAVSEETDKLDDDERDTELPRGIKRIYDLGVFAITATASLFAYVWMWICLRDQTVEIWEAALTFAMFFILIITSYAADRCKASVEEEDDTSDVPFTAAEIYTELIKEKQEKSRKRTDEEERKLAHMKKIVSENFGTTDITQVPLEDLKKKVDKEVLVKRLQYRKQAASAVKTIKKGEYFKFEHTHALAFEDKSKLNPHFGFKCLHYSISEASGSIKIAVISKSGE